MTMTKFSKVSLNEARAATLPLRKALDRKYRAFVRSLSPDTAGRLDLEANERPITVRARLKSAAKAEGVWLRILRRGDVIYCWLAEPTAVNPGADNGRRSSAGR